MICLPYSLYLEADKAAAVITDALSQASTNTASSPQDTQQLLSDLSSLQTLALALAVARKQGTHSPWHPYISTLPDTPPVPWLPSLSSHDVSAAVALALRGDTNTDTAAKAGVPSQGHQPEAQPQHTQQTEWEAAVYAARAQYEASAAHVLRVCGSRLGVSQEEVMWGLGNGVSRALTSGEACGLLPFIDLLNHDPDARPPMMQLDDADQLVMTVTPLRGNEVVPLLPGEELYINYTGGE